MHGQVVIDTKFMRGAHYVISGAVAVWWSSAPQTIPLVLTNWLSNRAFASPVRPSLAILACNVELVISFALWEL